MPSQPADAQQMVDDKPEACPLAIFVLFVFEEVVAIACVAAVSYRPLDVPIVRFVESDSRLHLLVGHKGTTHNLSATAYMCCLMMRPVIDSAGAEVDPRYRMDGGGKAVIKTDRTGMIGQMLRCTGLHCCSQASACWTAAMSKKSTAMQVPSC